LKNYKPLLWHCNIRTEINNSNVKHFREGKEEGAKEKTFEIARKLKAAGVDDAVILATTGFDANELSLL